MSTKKPFLFWTLIVLSLAGLLGWQIKRGVKIETNILELLPATEQDPVVEKSFKRFSEHVGRKTLFLIAHKDEQKAIEAADLFAQEIEKSEYFQDTLYKISDSMEKDYYELYFPHREFLLSDEDRGLLHSGNTEIRLDKKQKNEQNVRAPGEKTRTAEILIGKKQKNEQDVRAPEGKSGTAEILIGKKQKNERNVRAPGEKAGTAELRLGKEKSGRDARAPSGGHTPLGEKFIKKRLKMLYSPSSSLYTGLLDKDPLLLFPSFLQSLPKAPGNTFLKNKHILIQQDGKTYVLVATVLKGNPFSERTQQHVSPVITKAKELATKKAPDVEFLTSGVLPFAKAGLESAKKESSTIGLGSLIGIIFLMLFTFRSLRQLFFCLLPIAIGVLSAFSISFLVFPSLHILTLVFGASLIGVCIDYSFHYFSDQVLADQSWTPAKGLKQILPGITLGAITSVMAYIALAAAPFPGLRQMALFSSVGLLAAFGTVVCFFPVLSGPKPSKESKPALLFVAQKLLSTWQLINRQSWIIVTVLAILALALISQLKSNDDVRSLQQSPPELKEMDQKIRQLIGSFDASRFLLVEAQSTDALLDKETKLRHKLDQLQANKDITFYQAISSVLPSEAQQKRNKDLLQKIMLGKDKVLDQYMNELGFPEEIIKKTTTRLTDTKAPPLSLEKWLASKASDPLEHLYLGKTERGYASIIFLGRVNNESALLALEGKGLNYINKVDDFSKLFRRYRSLASWLVGLSYLAIFILLIFRYGFKKACLVMIPPVMAALMSLATLALFSVALNFFSLLALVLVLGIGIDYAIFFAESPDHSESTMLAIILSALSTILSFGLLALSETPVLRGFGLTVLFGIFFALIFSPIVRQRSQKE